MGDSRWKSQRKGERYDHKADRVDLWKHNGREEDGWKRNVWQDDHTNGHRYKNGGTNDGGSWQSSSRDRGASWSNSTWQDDEENGEQRRAGRTVVLVAAADSCHRREDGGKRAREEDDEGSSAKLRLVQQRAGLLEGPALALEEALKRKQDCPTDADVPAEMLADVKMVLDNDCWDGQYTGKAWVIDWLREGEEWGRHLQEGLSGDSSNWCRACWKAFDSEAQMMQHLETNAHAKRQKSWIWKFGLEPDKVPQDAGLAVVKSSSSTSSPSKDDERAQRRAEILGPTPLSNAARKGKPAEILALAAQIRSTPAAQAKRRLLEWRNGLPAAKRREVLRRIDLPRANDVASLSVLKGVFDETIAKSIDEVNDPQWIFKEPTFSWLSGFYWHPESTSLEQQGLLHGADFCHLCETDCSNFSEHSRTRRHADNELSWAERMGDMDHPNRCGRCRRDNSPEQRQGERSWNEPFSLDLQHNRAENKSDARPEPETTPPVGFKSVYAANNGSVRRTSYLAFCISGGDRRIAEMRVLSQRLRVGPKEKGAVKKKRTYVDLYWCSSSGQWKTLAMPCKAGECRTGDKVDFSVQIRWGSEKKDAWEELGWMEVEVPEAGDVAVHHCRYDWREQRGSNPWLNWVDRVECVPILEFVADGQVEAAGGIDELRGSQRPFQYATEDIMLSFWMYIPRADDNKDWGKSQLLMFFHGDMARSMQQCPLPGLADFCDIYGPALMVKDSKKENHPCRSFVVITPCCPEEYWWLRHPSKHDSTGYVASMELCLRRIIQWTQRLGICSSSRGACLAGQSMGAYMALEFARACPEMTQAVVAGAPCFDACRLDHLARRLVNVPVWLLIGRNDTLCSFEEVASLALKMRDLDAKCVRLTSSGIKGHSEVGAKLEHPRIYEWLREPLNRCWCSA